uniref:Uncharacterized protein n=1 Tax=Arundo donax TaxID=35708 RepID=A0A0A9HP58_ARUDO
MPSSQVHRTSTLFPARPRAGS